MDTQEPMSNPNSSGNGASKGNIAIVNKEQRGEYLNQFVTTNQSIQEIPSQTIATSNPLIRRLWSQQVEEESDEEGELHCEDDQEKEENDGQLSGHESDEVVHFVEEEEDDDAQLRTNIDDDKNEEVGNISELKAPELTPKPPNSKVQQSDESLCPNPPAVMP